MTDVSWTLHGPQMDFVRDELQESVAEAARAFARGRVAQTADAPRVPAEIWTELAELSLLSICVPEDLDGAGLGAEALFACVEELAQVSGAVAWGVVLAAEACAALGPDDPRLGEWMSGMVLARASAVEAEGSPSLGLRGLGAGLTLPEADAPAAQLRARALRRIGATAVSVGLAEAATQAALLYAAERKQFGRPLAAFQAIQFKLADARTEVAAARLLGHRAASSLEPGAVAQALAFATRIAPKVCSESLQVHGGYGYTTDFPVERMLRDATALGLVAAARVDLRADISEALLGS